MSGDLLETSRPLLAWVVRTTWEASAVAALVLLAQWLLRGRVSARWRYNLWLLVVARLVLPAVPGSQYSPFNWVRLPAPAQQPHVTPVQATPRLTPAPPRPAIPVPGPATEPDPSRNIYVASRNVPAREPAPAPTGDVELVSDESSAPAPARPVVRQHTTQASMGRPPEQLASAWAPPPAKVLGDAPRAAVPPAPEFIPSQPASARVAQVNWPAVAAGVWAAGVALALARVAWVSVRLWLAVRGLRPMNDPVALALLADGARQLGLRRPPRLLESPASFGPALVGLLRPRVVLPGCVLRGTFHADELRLILLHELAHLKRRDVAVNWLLAALGAVHWFNPVIRLAFRRMKADREIACDELVLSLTRPAASRCYGPTILKLLQLLSSGSPTPGAVGVLEGKSNLRRRIAMIARFDRNQRSNAPYLGVALSALIGGVALTGAVRGQQGPAAEGAGPRQITVGIAREEHDRDKAEGARDRSPAPEEREATRGGDDSDREGNDEAAAKRDALGAARDALDAARERLADAEQTFSERQAEAREGLAEADRAIAEARQQLDERQAESAQSVDAGRQVLDEVKQQFSQREAELRQALAEAKQQLDRKQTDAKPDDPSDDDDVKSTLAEKEEELKSLASEREDALREAQSAVEEASRDRETSLREARQEIEQAVRERQQAVDRQNEARQQAQQQLRQAVEQLGSAQQALSQAQQEIERQRPEALEPPAAESAPDAPPAPAPDGLTPPEPEAPAAPPVEATPPGAGNGPVVAAPAASAEVQVTSAAAPATSAEAQVTPTSVSVSTAAATPAIAPAGAAQPAAETSVSAAPAPVGAGGPAVTAAAPKVPTATPPRMATTPPAAAGYGGMMGSPAPSAGAPGGYGTPGGYGGRGYPGYGGYGNNRGGYGAYPPGYGGPAPTPRPGAGYPSLNPGAASDGQADAQVEDAAARDANQRAAEALRRTMPVSFNDVPLADALSFVGEQAGVDVVADWRVMGDAGVKRATPVNLTLRQAAPVEQVLTWVLRDAGGDRLGFSVEHGVIEVTSRERLSRKVITRAYNLGSLAENGGGLEQLVRDTVAPGSWREQGGPGSARVFNGQLFVTATEPNHRQVERLLGLMQAQGMGAAHSGAPMGAPGVMPGMPGRAPQPVPAAR